MSLCSSVSLLPDALTWCTVCPCCDLGRGIPLASGANKDSLLTNCNSDAVVKKWGFYHSAAFVSQSLLFPVSCLWWFLRFIKFEQFQQIFKDITILQVLNMGRWLWDYTTGNPLQYEAAENLWGWRTDEEKYTITIWATRKASIETHHLECYRMQFWNEAAGSQA